MAITLTVGFTIKSRNSTMQTFFTDQDHDTKTLTNCKLKEPTSIHDPTFLVIGLDHNKSYNFLQWEDRYYWINNIIYTTNDIFEIVCTLDKLATFKTYLRKTNSYFMLADKDHWNQYVDDYRFQPEKQASNIRYHALDIFHNADYSINDTIVPSLTISRTGTIFVRVMETAQLNPSSSLDPWYPDNTPADHQGVNTYALTPYNFRYCLMDLTDVVRSAVDLTGPSMTDLEFMQSVCKLWSAMGGAGSWRQNILSVTYVPIDYDSITTTQSGASNAMSTGYDGLFFGCIPSIVPCKKMLNPITIWQGHQSVELPWSDDTAIPGHSYEPDGVGGLTGLSFLRNDRWCNMQIYTPSGYQVISTPSIKEQTRIGVWSSLNVCTGDWSMRITEKNTMNDHGGENLCSFSGNIGVDLTGFVGSGSSIGSQINSFAPKVVGAVLGANFGGAGIGIASELMPSGIDPASASGTISGDITSMFLTNGIAKAYLVCQQFRPNISNDEYIDYCNLYGYPCNDLLNPETDSVQGYVKAKDALIRNCPGATLEDKIALEALLNSGIILQ